MVAASRGTFALKLYEDRGYEPGTSVSFSDAGYLSGVLGALETSGVTQGQDGGTFGVGDNITRGHALLMYARSIGVADLSTTPAQAAATLESTGVIKSVGDLNSDFPEQHIASLFSQGTAAMDSGAFEGYPSHIGNAPGEVAAAQETAQGEAAHTSFLQDPLFAATAAGLGLQGSQADIAYNNQTTAFGNRIAGLVGNWDPTSGITDLGGSYGMQDYEAGQGIDQDYGSRGFFRSGSRLAARDKSTAKIAMAAGTAVSGINDEQQAAADAYAAGIAGRHAELGVAAAGAGGQLTEDDYTNWVETYVPDRP